MPHVQYRILASLFTYNIYILISFLKFADTVVTALVDSNMMWKSTPIIFNVVVPLHFDRILDLVFKTTNLDPTLSDLVSNYLPS